MRRVTATLTCEVCGFDAARWSAEDLERTLAHSDDLIGHVVNGASDGVGSARLTDVSLDDRVGATHSLMHHLDHVATSRRGAEEFATMVGTVASVQASGGGVPKLPVAEVVVDTGGVLGDRQGNRHHHGRPWQAVCLYSADLLSALADEGHPIVAGGAGENVTISGVDWARMRGGLTIAIGDLRLRTSSPAAPCHKIGGCFADGDWMRMDHAQRPGWSRWYASVLEGGTIRPGDRVTIAA